ncbi:hypothetical protein APHAL10511_003144 [Amanita phalloides]|nr:hypothetical protein APHAL10511_003144 [Amanita phalloides]
METGMVDDMGMQWADEDGHGRGWLPDNGATVPEVATGGEHAGAAMGVVEGVGGEVELQDAVGAGNNVQAVEPESPVQAAFLPMALS